MQNRNWNWGQRSVHDLPKKLTFDKKGHMHNPQYTHKASTSLYI